MILNPENATEKEVASFRNRTAIRAVVYDSRENIGILSVEKQKYHKLPGGGKEDGESDYETLKRECLEELGCDIEILGEVGKIIEYRKMFNIKQTAICYLAKVVGQKGKPFFTEEETKNEFCIKWLSVEEAIFLLETDNPLDNEGKLYIVPREKLFLKKATKQKKF